MKNEREHTLASLQMTIKKQQERINQLEKILSFRDSDGGSSAAGSGETGEAERKTVDRSRLWSSISHEILTPMDAILGMTELVMDTELTEEQSNYLEMINASADRLFGVVSDVIDYSELMEGKLRRDMENFDLYGALEYDLYIAELSCKHNDLNFSVSFAKGIPNYINSDPARLRQVLNNLLSNAIHYTKTGSISVSVDKTGYDERGRILLRFTVEDTGMGIAPEKQQSIFETPMSLGMTGGEEKFSEGGLGLVVSARLVELFGGAIGVSSSEGKGSRFWFTWPVVNPVEMHMGELPADVFSQVQDRSLVLRGADVLLAEDEYINASITKTFLEQAGMNVTVVGNGGEAVKALKEKPFQAVLMDVQMPVMDGIEATLKIRRMERKSGKNTPIVALTAHGMHGDRERCLQAGMDDFLPKPLDRNLLIDMLARCMTKKALVVSADPKSQHEIIQPLVSGGWAVILAETGRLAMYEASLSHFDMIVVDASLPRPDGVKAVTTIRRLEEFSGCRAIILGVGFDSEAEYEQYADCGFDAFVTSDHTKDELTGRVAASR